MLAYLRARMFRPGIDDSLLGRCFRSAIFPPLLPLLGFLLFLTVAAIWESQRLPEDEYAEPLRWVLFVPFVVFVLYWALFFCNLLDAAIQRGDENKRWLSIAFSGAALSGVFCVFLFNLETITAYLVVIVCSYVAILTMNWWRNILRYSYREV